MGYEPPIPLGYFGPKSMKHVDLFVDVKAHQTYHRLCHAYDLEGKILWYRINGGKPEHVIKLDGTDCGDEVHPPCPVLTPNQWYRLEWEKDFVNEGGKQPATRDRRTPWTAYVCWPPLFSFRKYYEERGRVDAPDRPICLIHNLHGWGYGALVEPFRELGILMHGDRSPDGLVNHRQVPHLLSKALAYVHLKSNDAPGYALYEALAAACPVVCTRRLIWRCKMQDLFIPNETCLVFDRETHDGLTLEDVVNCTAEVKGHLERLCDPVENRRIGMNGHKRLKELMWSVNREEDVASLKAFMERNFV
jgi:hypothetical protein